MRDLFTKRMKAAEEAAARARGEDVDYLIEDASEEFRWQLWYALDRATSHLTNYYADQERSELLTQVQTTLLEEYGRPFLNSWGHPVDDLKAFLIKNATTPELMDAVGLVADVAAERGYEEHEQIQEFYKTIRARLREHKLAYDVVEMQVVPRASDELHREVVVPALTLLHGRTRFSDAERQYREALDELAKGNWADAITDANAAVEIVARAILSFEQGQLPGMLQELRKQGLFGDPQEGRLRKVVDGFSELADIRNKEGDAHGSSSDRGTAWLAVHWAGALIVYLVEQAEERGL